MSTVMKQLIGLLFTDYPNINIKLNITTALTEATTLNKL